jgi:uncharacterized membrane protein YhaH (DUF805 family)
MNFTTAIKTCFSKYVDWNGRALRSEYWYFYLFLMLGIFVTVLIDAVLGTSAFLGLFFLGTILPMFFVTIRRLHDVGRSGWWICFPWYRLPAWFCCIGPSSKGI